MKTYLQMDGDQLVEYVEKREYEAVVNQLHRICKEGFNSDDTIGLEPADDYILRKLAELKQALNQQLQDAVKRMDEVSMDELWYLFNKRNQSLIPIRTRLIQAAKGEHP